MKANKTSEIMKRLNEGEGVTSISRSLGVTRSYIYVTKYRMGLQDPSKRVKAVTPKGRVLYHLSVEDLVEIIRTFMKSG